MRWFGQEESSNIDDERGSSGGGGFGGFGGGGIRLGGGAAIVLIIISLLLGRNPMSLLGGGGGNDAAQPSGQDQPLPAQKSEDDDSAAHFVAVVLRTTEKCWDQKFTDMGRTYRKPTLVLFRSQIQSGCGGASASSGPFYCPADERLYIDLSFYDELKERFGSPGDFAMAYVVAHEVGHHVQKLLGTSDKMDEARGQVSETEYNKLSVRLELQADFYAGVWANCADKTLHLVDPGDVDEALQAATAIGDDRLQKESQGYVVPDAFTHGTSAQRTHWFKLGYDTGDITQGDTFGTPNL